MGRSGRPKRSSSEGLHEAVAERLQRAGLRYSSSRRRVVSVLAAADRPLTIPDILHRDPSLAQSSTYRNLAELISAGVVYRIVAGDEHGHYELSEALTHHHHHLVCSRCGRVEDFSPSEVLETTLRTALEKAAAAAGYVMERHRLDVVGTCPSCE